MDGGEDGDWEKRYNLTFVRKRICFAQTTLNFPGVQKPGFPVKLLHVFLNFSSLGKELNLILYVFIRVTI